MEVSETKSPSGYAKPPWLFKGSSLYQFHLVKAATARAFIPKELRLVEAFGYTLGGFFLAHYDDSPVGKFDELVVIAGIVWNPPTSCAWAARVLVNNHEACRHGRKDVGLPSHFAGFSKKIAAITEKPRDKSTGFLNMIGLGSALHNTKHQMNIEVSDIEGSSGAEFCSIKLPASGEVFIFRKVSDVSGAFGDRLKCISTFFLYPLYKCQFKHLIISLLRLLATSFVIAVPPESSSVNSWMGPVVKMSLPSFSGKTEYNPQLLKYSCQIECRVRPVKTSEVSGPISSVKHDREESYDAQSLGSVDSPMAKHAENDSRERSISVLLSKPLLALQFNFLRMEVGAPNLVASQPLIK